MAETSDAASALAEALKDPKFGPKIRAKIHPVSLSRFIHRRRRPGLDTARFLDEVTGGAVPMNGWRKLKPVRKAA